MELGVKNFILIDGKSIHWNHVAVNEFRTMRLIAAVGEIDPTPITELRIRDNADCALVQRIRTTLQRTVDCA